MRADGACLSRNVGCSGDGLRKFCGFVVLSVLWRQLPASLLLAERWADLGKESELVWATDMLPYWVSTVPCYVLWYLMETVGGGSGQACQDARHPCRCSTTVLCKLEVSLGTRKRYRYVGPLPDSVVLVVIGPLWSTLFSQSRTRQTAKF